MACWSPELHMQCKYMMSTCKIYVYRQHAREKRWKVGRRMGVGRQRKSQDSASGQRCQVRWMVIDVGFYSACDKPPNRNRKNNGTRASSSPTHKSSKSNFSKRKRHSSRASSPWVTVFFSLSFLFREGLTNYGEHLMLLHFSEGICAVLSVLVDTMLHEHA